MLVKLTNWHTPADNVFDTPEWGAIVINLNDVAEMRPSGSSPPATRITFRDQFRPKLDVTEIIAEIMAMQHALHVERLNYTMVT